MFFDGKRTFDVKFRTRLKGISSADIGSYQCSNEYQNILEIREVSDEKELQKIANLLLSISGPSEIPLESLESYLDHSFLEST
jgi:hypothetical protein